MQASLNRPDGDCQNGGNLFLRTLAVASQHQDFTKMFGQAHHRLIDTIGLIFLNTARTSTVDRKIQLGFAGTFAYGDAKQISAAWRNIPIQFVIADIGNSAIFKALQFASHRPTSKRQEHLLDVVRPLRHRKPTQHGSRNSRQMTHRGLKDRSHRLKEPSTMFCPEVHDGRMALRIDGQPPCRLNDWSFSQLCGIAGVAKETVNRLMPETATRVLTETLRQRSRDGIDLQSLVYDNALIRAVNGDR
jgi:hypothetical protein